MPYNIKLIPANTCSFYQELKLHLYGEIGIRIAGHTGSYSRGGRLRFKKLALGSDTTSSQLTV